MLPEEELRVPMVFRTRDYSMLPKEELLWSLQASKIRPNSSSGA